MPQNRVNVAIIGGGLAGAECAYQLSRAGVHVRLYEMRPNKTSEAHHTNNLAELVCSNSFRAKSVENAVGLIKEEMRRVGSLIMTAADHATIPAGGAHGVDRDIFSDFVTRAIEEDPRIELVRREVQSLDTEELNLFQAVIVATGPLTSSDLARDLVNLTGRDRLYFYDAIAPVIEADSVQMDRVFRASRYGKGGDDYLNCPMDESLYNHFIDELLLAETAPLHEEDEARFFPGCQPIEEIARLGRLSPAFGPMKPVGLTDPATGKRPYAVVQLRLENKQATSFNMVGFQTRLKYPDQKRVFRLIPGLEEACFLRLGSVHRNTYLDSPRVLDDRLRLPENTRLRFAGQITGVEGYVESTACGLIQGILTASELLEREVPPPPLTTALGSMLAHLRDQTQPDFQPSNIHWGHFTPLSSHDLRMIPRGRKGRRAKRQAMSERALNAIRSWSVTLGQNLYSDAP
jgi:methylenetetrahydrofolate--tRNA-(uracil-5-)-methyltransferase